MFSLTLATQLLVAGSGRQGFVGGPPPFSGDGRLPHLRASINLGAFFDYFILKQNPISPRRDSVDVQDLTWEFPGEHLLYT